MKKLSLVLILLLAVLTVSAKGRKKNIDRKKSAPDIQVVNLRVENMHNPNGIATAEPRFSWQIMADGKDLVQTSYRITVLTPAKADTLWDSGVVSSADQLWVKYAGRPLADNQRAEWRVTITTSDGRTATSTPGYFSVGLTSESHWRGSWIGIDRCLDGENQGYRTRLAARYLRREAKVEDKEILTATAYVAGIGLYEFYVNGQRKGTDVLAPQPTDYRKSVIYNTFDLTDEFRNARGKDICLGVVLGNGRVFPMRQSKPYKSPVFGFPKCRVNVIVEYADGTKGYIVSDEKWKVSAQGPIRANNEYDGEEYDARMELGEWSTTGYADSLWLKAERTDIPMGELHGQMAPNMTVTKHINPVKVIPHGQNFIVDFGQNMAGWVQLAVRGNEGDTIRIKYAEKLDSLGNLYLKNLRDALSEDIYVCNGREQGRPWHSTFVYHGFRYVEVKGVSSLNASDVEAQTVSDDMQTIGSLSTSNPVLNRIYQNAWWGIHSNYKGMPVDCPQRNERQPWLGDRTVGSLGESFLFDNERLYTKWMRDICESQRSDGALPGVAPTYWRYFNEDITWPAVLPFTCEMLYEQFGNDQPIRDSYPYIKKWINHMISDYLVDNIMTHDKYGDWCVPPESLELIHSKDPARQTDGELISTAYTIRIMRLMHRFAKMQGLTDDAASWKQYEEDMTEAFNRKFLVIKRGTSLRPGHTLYPDSVFYGNNTATANLLPLALGIVPSDCKDEVVKNVVTNIITRNNGHVSCGVIGISWLMRGLSDNGFADVAYLLATNRSYPSWGYMVDNGATTIWELWNGDKANPAMNSGNHVMLLGDLLTWCYQYLGGIRNAEGSVAYRHMVLKPSFEIQDLDNVDMSYNTPYGTVVSAWRKTLEHLWWHVEIPVGSTADVCLPDGTVMTVGSGSHDFDCNMPLNRTNDYSDGNSSNSSRPTIVADEFVYSQTDFPECHSASIVELDNGDLVATYFGGTKERNPDVCIWVQRKAKGSDQWSDPILAADGVFRLGTEDARIAGIDSTSTPATKGYIKLKEALAAMPGFHYTAKNAKTNGKAADDEDQAVLAGGKYNDSPASSVSSHGSGTVSGSESFRRKACWNPVLCQMPSGELWLFFKIGLKVADWTGWLVKSKDGGKTWSEREPLERGFLGPVKNKPVFVDNRMICPTSTEGDGWKFHFEILDLTTNQWKYISAPERELAIRTPDMNADGTLADGKQMRPIDCIQPSILIHPDGRLQAVGRTRNAHIASTWSTDGGDTWSKVTLLDAPNNQSGTDAVTLKDGRHVMICNNFETLPDTPKGVRTPCSLMISDDGINWRHWLTLEDSPISQYSYPSIIQGSDGTLHCIYTWRRQRIKYMAVKP